MIDVRPNIAVVFARLAGKRPGKRFPEGLSLTVSLPEDTPLSCGESLAGRLNGG